MKKSLTTIATAGVATIAIGHGHEAHENKDIIQMIQLHTTLTLSTNKVTIITLGKVTGAQIK